MYWKIRKLCFPRYDVVTSIKGTAKQMTGYDDQVKPALS